MNTWALAYKSGSGRAIAHPLTFKTWTAAVAFLERHGWEHMHPVKA